MRTTLKAEASSSRSTTIDIAHQANRVSLHPGSGIQPASRFRLLQCHVNQMSPVDAVKEDGSARKN
jgi:hypothetical protein